MKKILYGLFCLILANYGCSPGTPTVIILQPLGNYSEMQTMQIRDGLIKFYGIKICVAKNTPLPGTAYYKPLNRYSANLLLQFLSAKKDTAYTIIGLTNQDIFTAKNNNLHWGVMGLGTLNADASIVSSFRLHHDARLYDELVKLSAHELGHNFGLHHCPDKTCIMADAEGHNNFYRETGFCVNCRKKLLDIGVMIR